MSENEENRKRREFTPEFKAGAVKLVLSLLGPSSPAHHPQPASHSRQRPRRGAESGYRTPR
jgi:hypothetical protein